MTLDPSEPDAGAPNALEEGRAATWVVAAIPFVLLAVVAYFVFAETQDDAFITYRFAANLASGHGAVFNPGEHVEGYSSPLHMLLSTALVLARGSLDILFASKVIGLLLAAGTLGLMAPLGRKLGLSRGEVLCAQLLVALNPSYAISAVNGLETSLYGLAIIGTVVVFGNETSRGRGWLSGLLAFLIVVSRPDGMLIAFLLAALRLYLGMRSKSVRSLVVPWLAALALPSLAFLAVRWSYYGYPLPNTYYAKNIPLVAGVSGGVRYLTKVLAPRTNHIFEGVSLFTKLVIAASVPVFWGLLGAGVWQVRRLERAYASLAVLLANTVFVLKSGGDWMHGWRFCVPAMPFMCLVLCFGLRGVASLAKARNLPAALQEPKTGQVAMVLFWTLGALVSPHKPWHSVGFSTHGRDFLRASQDEAAGGQTHVILGDWIADNLPRGASVAYSEMGYSGVANMDKSFIDVLGLISADIAHGAPRAVKSSLGVMDPALFQDGSVVGKLIVERAPRYVIYRGDGGPQLRARYELAHTLPDTFTLGPTMYVYELKR